MDTLEKLLARFEKIAPHLRNELVLIGFVFLLSVSSAALGVDQILVFGLALFVILGIFAVLFFKLRHGKHLDDTLENSDAEIRMARRLAELADQFEHEYPKGSKDLRKEARRILYFARMPDLAADIQRQIDEAEPPPKEPDPPR